MVRSTGTAPVWVVWLRGRVGHHSGKHSPVFTTARKSPREQTAMIPSRWDRHIFRADFRFTPSQWEMALLCNNVSYWLGASLGSALIIITRDSEGIMFSPCVFVCVCVSVYVCHDVCPDDLTMKDWCQTKNILQIHCWGCLVVQAMFHTLMTSLMTSQDHKVGQKFWNWYISVNIWVRASIKSSMSEMLSPIFLVYSTSGITFGKIVCRELKMAAILKILKY